MDSNSFNCIPYLTTKFFTTDFESRVTACGIKKNALTNVTTIGELQTVFTNEYTQMENGIPKVKSMMAEDIDNILGYFVKGGTNLSNANYKDLFAIPSKDKTGKWAWTWFATQGRRIGNYYWLCYLCGDEGILSDGYSKVMGVRPVVSLKTNVQFKKNISKNMWDISIE